MKKKNILIITIVLIIILITFVILVSLFKNTSDEQVPSLTTPNTKLETLENILSSSTYFKDSSITTNEDKQSLTIDDKYEVIVKSGYYMMTIKDIKLEDTYCQIVDSIETSLGASVGSSIETCTKTLDGLIDMGGISAEIYEDYIILSVNSEELANLYDEFRSHSAEELISVDEINYNLNIDDYLFTSMSTGFTEATKEYTICGHLYNKDNKEKTFLFKIYDNNKSLLNEQSFTYTNDSNKYTPFCLDFASEVDNIKYYSIEAHDD